MSKAKLQRAHEEIQDILDAWTEDSVEALSAVCAARDAIEAAQRLLAAATKDDACAR